MLTGTGIKEALQLYTNECSTFAPYILSSFRNLPICESLSITYMQVTIVNLPSSPQDKYEPKIKTCRHMVMSKYEIFKHICSHCLFFFFSEAFLCKMEMIGHVCELGLLDDL